MPPAVKCVNRNAFFVAHEDKVAQKRFHDDIMKNKVSIECCLLINQGADDVVSRILYTLEAFVVSLLSSWSSAAAGYFILPLTYGACHPSLILTHYSILVSDLCSNRQIWCASNLVGCSCARKIRTGFERIGIVGVHVPINWLVPCTDKDTLK